MILTQKKKKKKGNSEIKTEYKKPQTDSQESTQCFND